MFDLYIFDIGGVFLKNPQPEIDKQTAKMLGITDQAFADEFKKYDRRVVTGHMSIFEAYSAICQTLGQGACKAQELIDEHGKLFQELAGKASWNKDLIDLIQQLRKSSWVVALTNVEIESAIILREWGVFQYFDKAFLSTKIGLMKPDPECYRHVLETMKVVPEKAILIDDREENIEGAIAIGMNGILFESVEKLQEILVELKS